MAGLIKRPEKVEAWPGEYPGALWLGEEEMEAACAAIASRTLFRQWGPAQPRHAWDFEEAARDFYGSPYALAVNSGTGALAVCLKAMDIGPGDEVIIPSFMWIATISAVVEVNAIPVIAEVDETYTLDPDDFERKITERTRAVIPVHMAGVPCQMDRLLEIAQRHHVRVLEDVAQANGGRYRGRMLGTLGDMGIFSLHTNKNITAGEGGLILTNDRVLYERAFVGHDMGYLFQRDRTSFEDPPEALQVWPTGRRMGELLGAVATEQLRKLPRIVDSMRRSKALLKECCGELPGARWRRLVDPEGDSGPFAVLECESEGQAIDAVKAMREGGLHSVWRIHEYTYHISYNIPMLLNRIPLSPAGNPWDLPQNRESRHAYDEASLPRSSDLFRRGILMPVPSRLNDEQVRTAARVIRAALGGR